MSLTYRRNRVGPSMLPCGTPELRALRSTGHPLGEFQWRHFYPFVTFSGFIDTTIMHLYLWSLPIKMYVIWSYGQFNITGSVRSQTARTNEVRMYKADATAVTIVAGVTAMTC